MSTEKAVHLVLSAGGVRCLSYIGALKVLDDHGVTIKSISCCSGGTIFGAFRAFDVSIKKVEEHVIQKGFGDYHGHYLYRMLRRLFSLFKYPFAAYQSTRMNQFFTDITGGFNPTLSACKIPFATIGIDIVNDRYIVFSDTTHPDMKVSEAIQIANAVPGLFPPVERNSRIIVDAGISTLSPVWLAYRQMDDAPILVLKPQSINNLDFMQSLPKFLLKLFSSSAQSLDWFMFQADPRIKVVEINSNGILARNFRINRFEVQSLIDNGANAMQQALSQGLENWSIKGKKDKSLAFKNYSQDDAGAVSAEQLIKALLGKLRNKVFISYNAEDKSWFKKVEEMMAPLEQKGLQIWSVDSIQAGEDKEKLTKDALDSTKVAVLLVTKNYLDDDSLYDEELAYFVDAAQRKELELLWVLVSPCDYKNSLLSNIKPANDPEKPLKKIQGAGAQDEQIMQIVDEIIKALD